MFCSLKCRMIVGRKKSSSTFAALEEAIFKLKVERDKKEYSRLRRKTLHMKRHHGVCRNKKMFSGF